MTNNKGILSWIEKIKQIVSPDKIVWIDGSESQLEKLRTQACKNGEMIKLNQEKLPGCYLHRTALNVQAVKVFLQLWVLVSNAATI